MVILHNGLIVDARTNKEYFMKIKKSSFPKLKKFYKPKLVRKILIGIVLIGIIFSSLGGNFSYKAPLAKAAEEPLPPIDEPTIRSIEDKILEIGYREECGFSNWQTERFVTKSSCKDELQTLISGTSMPDDTKSAMNVCLDDKFKSGRIRQEKGEEGNLSGNEMLFCLYNNISVWGSLGSWLKGEIAEKVARIITAIAKLVGGGISYLIRLVLSGIEGVLAATNFTKVDAVKTAWGIVRDICNMFFILILLAIVFGTILGLESYHAKRLLPWLVIAIILVNFSMMICGIIVDFSQILMIGFLSPLGGQSLANVLLNGLKINSYSSVAAGTGLESLEGTGLGNVFYTTFLSLITLIGVLVTLLVLLIMLVIRLVAIWILVTLSPLVFVAQILPATQQYAKKWWSEFLKYVMFGPAIAFFLMLTVLVIKGGDMGRTPTNIEPVVDQVHIGEQIDSNPLLASKGSSASNFLQTVFILTLLGAGMFAAKQSSIMGAGAVVGGAGKVAKWGVAPLKKGAITAGKGLGSMAKAGARKTGVPSWFKARGEKMADWRARRELAEKKRIAKGKIPRGLSKEEKRKEKARIETRFLAKEAATSDVREEAEARVEALKPEEISATIGREKNQAMIYAEMKKAGQEGKLEPRAFKASRVKKLINKPGQENLQKIASKKNPLVYYDNVAKQAETFAKLSGDDLAKVSPDAIRGASKEALNGIDPAAMGRAVGRGSAEFRKAVEKQMFYFRSETQIEIRKQFERLGMKLEGPEKVPGITKEVEPGQGSGRKFGNKGRGGSGGTV